MAKRRTLKGYIKLACGELFSECVAVSLYHNINVENATAMLQSIIKTQNDFVSRVSHVEKGMKAKDFFKDLRNGFTAQATEIIDQINNSH